MTALTTLLLSALLCLSAVSPLAASGPEPDPDEELARIAAAYAALDTYAVEIVFALYSNSAATAPFEAAEASIERRGRLLRSRMADIETVVGEQVLVVADHDSRVLMIAPRPPTDTPPLNLELDPASFDLMALLGEKPEALLKSAAVSLRVEATSRTRCTLAIDYPRGEYRRAEIVYDPRTYLLEGVVLYFRQPLAIGEGADAAAPHIEARYRNFEARPVFAADTFSTDRFFTRGQEGEIQPTPSFREYRLIQHLTPPSAFAEEEPP